MTQAQETLDAITRLRDECYEVSKSKGWWNEDEERTFGDFVALFHTEISEAFEEYRDNHLYNEIYYKGDKPEGIPIELADILIRIFDFCGGYNIDIANALDIKIAYNKTRPYRHGGKVI